MTQAPPPADLKLQRSSRDATTLPARLAEWLATVLPEGADPVVTLHSGIDANGMSSETLDLRRDLDRGRRAAARRVRRPGRAVARRLPGVPELRAPGPVRRDADRRRADRRPGADRGLDGADRRGARHAVLPDGPDRRASCRRTCCRTTSATTGCTTRPPRTSAACRTHRSGDRRAARDPGRRRRVRLPRPGTHAGRDACWRRNLARTRAWYELAVPDIGRSPLVERGARLARGQHARAPTRPSSCWGDSPDRQHDVPDFEPVARPRLGDGRDRPARDGPRRGSSSRTWSSSRSPGCSRCPGMPHFMREDDVGATYEEITGVELGDLTGTTSTTPSSGASSSCAPAPGRSTSARSSGPTTSRRSSTTSRSWSGCSSGGRAHEWHQPAGRVPDPPGAAADGVTSAAATATSTTAATSTPTTAPATSS